MSVLKWIGVCFVTILMIPFVIAAGYAYCMFVYHLIDWLFFNGA